MAQITDFTRAALDGSKNQNEEIESETTANAESRPWRQKNTIWELHTLRTISQTQNARLQSWL